MYYSIKLFAKAAERAGSVETEALIAGLEGVEVMAPEGRVWIRAQDHQGIVNDTICVVEVDESLPSEQWLKIVARYEGILPELQGDAR